MNKHTALYFIGANAQEGPTKVGISGNPKARLKQLQIAQPEQLTLFAFLWIKNYNAADKAEQWLLNEFFKADRLQGEWIKKGARKAQITAMLALGRKFGAIVESCETIWDLPATDEEVLGFVKPRHGAQATAEQIERLFPNGGFPGDDRTPISS